MIPMGSHIGAERQILTIIKLFEGHDKFRKLVEGVHAASEVGKIKCTHGRAVLLVFPLSEVDNGQAMPGRDGRAKLQTETEWVLSLEFPHAMEDAILSNGGKPGLLELVRVAKIVISSHPNLGLESVFKTEMSAVVYGPPGVPPIKRARWTLTVSEEIVAETRED